VNGTVPRSRLARLRPRWLAMPLARCRCQMAQLSLLPDVPVKLAGDGRGASTRRRSAVALLMRQRGEAPLAG